MLFNDSCVLCHCFKAVSELFTLKRKNKKIHEQMQEKKIFESPVHKSKQNITSMIITVYRKEGERNILLEVKKEDKNNRRIRKFSPFL